MSRTSSTILIASLVGDPQSIHKSRRLSSLTHTLGNRFAAAMNQHWIDADRFKENDITKQTLNQVIVLHGAATILDDKRLTAEFLDKGKRLQKRLCFSDLGSDSAFVFLPLLGLLAHIKFHVLRR